MKKILLALLSLILLVAMLAAGGLYYALQSAAASGPLSETKIVLIERGKGVSAIAQTLKAESVIASPLVFKLKSHLDGDTRPLKAGEYEFPSQISMNDALEMLRAGKVYDRQVTFPVGQTSWQMVQTLKNLTDLSGDIADVPADGTLLPETYHYIKDQARAAIIADMTKAMDRAVEELWPTRADDLPFSTKEEAMTLASIVEKETGVASERPRIAGVFINRLKKGMPLQSDPTVIYAITKGEVQTEGQGPIGRRLLTKDLSQDSPYNTYLNVGLPPSPIANPGRASIAAVLQPEVNDYLYFVADGSGGHVFSKTLAEHNSNVARWRKIRKSQP